MALTTQNALRLQRSTEICKMKWSKLKISSLNAFCFCLAKLIVQKCWFYFMKAIEAKPEQIASQTKNNLKRLLEH